MTLAAGKYDIVGIDEVGRGSWAGPLVFAAYQVDIPWSDYIPTASVNDSKKLTRQKREQIFAEIKQKSLAKQCRVELVITTAEAITKFGLAKALNQALLKLVGKWDAETTIFLIDGNYRLATPGFNYQAIPQGDAKVYSIAMAANYAKVYRDNLMRGLSDKYPVYGFSTNVGYGTQAHRLAIATHGVTSEHRLSYKPLQRYLIN